MSVEFDKLKAAVNKTKTALFNSWRNNSNSFVDKNYFKESGIYSEGVGLTATTMLLVAFAQEPEIITAKDKATIAMIAEQTVTKLYDWVSHGGYSALPLIKDTDSRKLFDTTYGYTDTITWVLSAAILLRYVQRKEWIALSEETHNRVNELLSGAFFALCNAQRPDGTWGFRSDTSSSKALYFTYTAAVSLADFFDYILGELSQDEEKDTSMLELMGENGGMDATAVEQLAVDTREKLQSWLIYTCLPLLPRLAECKDVTDDEQRLLGTWKTNISADSGLKDNYYQLYYTYYLLEMMVTSATDDYFERLIAADPDLKQLRQYYAGNKLMDMTDREFHFSSRDTINDIWLNIMEQSIYTTRSKYMIAKRTGDSFWSDISSELKISWLHEEQDVSAQAYRVTRTASITDPTLTPLALRANINYSYYISKQQDIVIARLFDEICEDTADKTNAECTQGLWDKTNYSLLITEKSIEALVDYYDYIVKFIPAYREADAQDSAVGAAPKSELDLLLDKKIEDYLHSSAGIKAILSASSPLQAGSMEDFRADLVFENMRQIIDIAENSKPDWNSPDEYERMTSALQHLYLTGMRINLRNRTGDDRQKYEMLLSQLDSLFKTLVRDIGKDGFSLTELYTKLKMR